MVAIALSVASCQLSVIHTNNRQLTTNKHSNQPAFLTSAATASLAACKAFFGSGSSPFKYFSQNGLPITNCCRPNAWLGKAFAISSCARTSPTNGCIQLGFSLSHLSYSDL